ncbi:MAG: peptide/nickel transport system ATP-binding protein [Clostridia bacterium]|nr:peptide/nickel transport system ATP-binding protein [Clostridia bacterium]MDN5322989.1 peptide/nickel transport system ATP-binding protein [Clostridia bacterium]
MSEKPILEVKDLKTHFFTEAGTVKAVDGVSFQLKKGETLGIVGESGSGKSITAMSIMRLIPSPPGRIVGGEIIFKDRDLTKTPEKELQKIRGNEIAMIFQDPMTSLNPVLKIGEQIAEAIIFHQGLSKKEAWRKAVKMLEKVGIPQPELRANDYPHQFSGGMRQRAMIAMALSCNPQLLIADEPTTALDVTIQAQILELMNQLKEEYQTAIIMITHDLGVVAELCNNVVVMYAGKPVEITGVETIFEKPKHPYTWGLLSSLPKLEDDYQEKLEPIEGAPPDLRNLPQGCSFVNRCKNAHDKCLEICPPLLEVEQGHFVACHLY